MVQPDASRRAALAGGTSGIGAAAATAFVRARGSRMPARPGPASDPDGGRRSRGARVATAAAVIGLGLLAGASTLRARR